MAYIITTTKRVPVAGHLDPIEVSSHATRQAVATLDWASETVATLINRPGYTLDRLKFETGGTFTTPDGTVVEVEFWGAARAVNWMVEHGYDPQTESFIDTFNTDNN